MHMSSMRSSGQCSTSGRSSVAHKTGLGTTFRHMVASARVIHLSNNQGVLTAASSIQQAEASKLKQQLYEVVQGIDRGIFGVPASKRQEVAAVVEALEAVNPLQNPTQHLEQVAGSWHLLYTTISITVSNMIKSMSPTIWRQCTCRCRCMC
eukprot:GHRR01036485.1.p1 GENE.GHRR01036485.1~~GHRR01036485.1.p1  ORF type:complete len:151 (+),score=36.31 GHRR01036485.1:88-540(+)